ncbi:aldose 1-epimerase family protein [Enterovirga aerilata]|uniref:Aldose 1-epimerase family protein n=1 Tax=Enterovirga aerilata TaxID=2730920 RepID=A0A849I224_9HYPH|nr:aldose 1-epimerase family protein [Enterovirga sp. DB1703]NNM71664.1 aldose 1-epimerase family protein [Enterovirga sp. DB1703]
MPEWNRTRTAAELIHLAAGDTTTAIALRGAESVSWQVDWRELLWRGDPQHWEFHAPILFPRVGASSGGVVQVADEFFPMPQHGFARRAAFRLIEQNGASARLRLCDSEATREHYPFEFELDACYRLGPDSLRLGLEVTNTGDRDLPYAIGFHPAFPWPLSGTGKGGHRVVFEAEESDLVPEVAAGGLLARRSRRVPMNGRKLPLSPELFAEAMVFLDAKSRWMRFEAPDGAAILMQTEGFPHLAVWSRPTAPFLSLECWSGHADWEDASGQLGERASMTNLRPRQTGRHAVTLRWERGRG